MSDCQHTARTRAKGASHDHTPHAAASLFRRKLASQQHKRRRRGPCCHFVHRAAPCSAHPFLSHDSWADCTRTFTVPLAALTDHKGRLTQSAARAMLEAVNVCPRLKPRTQGVLLAVALPEA